MKATEVATRVPPCALIDRASRLEDFVVSYFRYPALEPLSRLSHLRGSSFQPLATTMKLGVMVLGIT